MYRRSLLALTLTIGFSLACGSSTQNALDEVADEVAADGEDAEDTDQEDTDEDTCCCKKSEEGDVKYMELEPDACGEDGECIELEDDKSCAEMGEATATKAPPPPRTQNPVAKPSVKPAPSTGKEGKGGKLQRMLDKGKVPGRN